MKRPKPLLAAALVLGGIFLLILVIGFLGMSGFGSFDPYKEVAFPLTDSEEAWKDNIQQQYQCKLHYFGPDIDSGGDTVIVVTFELAYKSRLAPMLDRDIEGISEKIGDAYVNKTHSGRKETHLLLVFNNWHSGEIATNIPQSRSCFYNLKIAAVVPGIKRLVIPYYTYCYVDDETQNLYVSRMGTDHKSKRYFARFEKFGLEKRNSNSYKGLDSCETWETTIPQKIPVRNGYLEAKYQFVFYRGKVISVVISYQGYPENENFIYADVVGKLRRKLRSRKELKQDGRGTCSEYLNPNSLNYESHNYGIVVKATADTTSVPWKIRYETAIDEPRWYSDTRSE